MLQKPGLIVALFFLAGLSWLKAADSGQSPGIPVTWLRHPLVYADSLHRIFDYQEVAVFHKPLEPNVVVLENGYVQSRIVNASDWSYDPSLWAVSRVEVVFTRYPWDFHRWRTPYYLLLARRLEAMFALDARLNDSSISFGLVLQTAGRTEAEARKLFHGLVIYLEPLALAEELDRELPDEPEEEQPPTPSWEGRLLPAEQLRLESPLKGPRPQLQPTRVKCPRWR